jgi:hypothetical protein
MRAGQIRVRVEVDERLRQDLDLLLKDWEPELAEDTRKGLESGECEVFWVTVDQLHCDAPECPHHENIGALGGTVVYGIWTPDSDQADYTLREVLEGIEADAHELLTEIVKDILREVDSELAGVLHPDEVDRATIDELL